MDTKISKLVDANKIIELAEKLNEADYDPNLLILIRHIYEMPDLRDEKRYKGLF